MTGRLDSGKLASILQAENVQSLSRDELRRLFQDELKRFLPDGICQVDPRSGDSILYNSARVHRPHDNRPPAPAGAPEEPACPICRGDTTGVVDVASLSQGFTFINKNLYPVLYPADPDRPARAPSGEPGPQGQSSFGFHFLQWTSSWHDRDWRNMPLADRVIVVQRLAALEQTLLADCSDTGAQNAGCGFVSIVKNYGHLVGGSLAHDHQQIAWSNVMPRRMGDHERFQRRRGETFAAYLLRENPAQLVVRDYGPALLLVPYFMRRPYDMMLVMKDATRRHLYQLDAAEVAAAAAGWGDAIGAIHAIMPAIGRETAYNVVAHNGPGAGLYFEFLPYTQETGGFEHLGLIICQHNPAHAAAHLRQTLAESSGGS